MQQKPDVMWKNAAPIMLKLTNNATQAQYEEMAANEDALREQLSRLWQLASRCRAG
ncbi:hypothetical protein PHMEG_0007307 [Phytophthora megakarya]|uniref:Uncharacterized protein n=1 Tax=Phytophthora megakarya TaxID=4795 RepID=A0A225WNN0_9STRA|nr:hypothetical protein PHMEG_0007307 [Phytophthora megakarya]